MAEKSAERAVILRRKEDSSEMVMQKFPFEEMLATIFDRLAQTTHLRNELLSVKSKLYIFGNATLIINWDEELGVEIRNQDIVDFLTQFFRIVKLYGRKVDQNPKLEAFLTRPT